MITQNSGPSYNAPPFAIDEAKRSKTSCLLPPEERWSQSWDPLTLHQFNPDRWLVANEKTGEMVFESNSGPLQVFGGGLRGCFGRKLAMLNLRIVFALVAWHFELLPVPKELVGFEGMDLMTHQPQQVHLRLKECIL